MLGDALAVPELPDLSECEIELQAAQNGGYAVAVKLPDGDTYRTVEPIPFDPAPFLQMYATDPLGYGQQLFETFLSGKPREGFVKARTLAEQEHKQLRVRLNISPDAQALHGLNWELLYDASIDTALAASPATTFSRYLDVNAPLGKPINERPLKILVVISNPSNLERDFRLPQLDTNLEREKIKQSLDRVGAQVECTFLQERSTLKNLRAALEQGGFHVLHVLAHGLFSQREQKGYLALQQDDGTLAQVSENDFDDVFVGLEKIRLVVLAACLSAARSQANAFMGMGPSLVRRGIPAVIAMQRPIGIPAAQTFTESFYKHLSQFGIVDAAMNRARYELYLDGERKAAGVWGIPVLFMRTERGELFFPTPVGIGERLPEGVRDRFLPILKLFVDRDDQYQKFQDMVSSRAPERILFLHGPQGMGKTWLINKCAAWCAAERVAWSLVDFRNNETWDYLYTLDRLVADNLNQEAFSVFRTLRAHAAQVGGEHDITSPLQGELTSKFIEGLSRLSSSAPIVLFIDSLDQEQALPLINNWLWTQVLRRFLDLTMNLQRVTIVVAGRIPPTMAPEWQNTLASKELVPLEAKHFVTFAQRRGVNLPPEQLKLIFQTMTSSPDKEPRTPFRFALWLDSMQELKQ